MKPVPLPKGVGLHGEIWGQRVRVWIEEEWKPAPMPDDEEDEEEFFPHTVRRLVSSCGEVSRQAPLWLTWTWNSEYLAARNLKDQLAEMGYRRVTLVEPNGVVDFQI